MSANDSNAAEARSLMHKLFYAVFDETGGLLDGQAGFLVDVPNGDVGDLVARGAGVVAMAARLLTIEPGARLKVEVTAPDLLSAQTKIMQYFAHEVNKNPDTAVTFRLPGIGWQARADKEREHYDERETMFAETYAKLIAPPERLARVVKEAWAYE